MARLPGGQLGSAIVLAVVRSKAVEGVSPTSLMSQGFYKLLDGG